ncbi:conserved hypothetical protein [Rhodococcus sp. RD6.2]|nr:conserved hypothetical protein [Rhodococcus sp. RD6.2]
MASMEVSDGTVRWLKRFLTDWYGDWRPDYGTPPGDLPVPAPTALAELYAFVGRWPTQETGEHLPESPMILQHQDVLVRPSDLVVVDGHVDFVRDHQDAWTCRVRADAESSAVWSNAHWMWTDVDTEDYVKLTPTLEHFLTSFVLQETVLGCRNLAVVEDDGAPIATRLTEQVTPLWLNGWYVFGEPEHSFWRAGPYLLADISGTRWIGWNDSSRTLPTELAAEARMISTESD